MNSTRAAESPGSQCWEIIWGEGMGTQNGKEYKKAFYRAGDFVKFSSTLVWFTDWHMPWKVENHSPATLVYAGCLLLGEEPGSSFGGMLII